MLKNKRDEKIVMFFKWKKSVIEGKEKGRRGKSVVMIKGPFLASTTFRCAGKMGVKYLIFWKRVKMGVKRFIRIGKG